MRKPKGFDDGNPELPKGVAYVKKATVEETGFPGYCGICWHHPSMLEKSVLKDGTPKKFDLVAYLRANPSKTAADAVALLDAAENSTNAKPTRTTAAGDATVGDSDGNDATVADGNDATVADEGDSDKEDDICAASIQEEDHEEGVTVVSLSP